MEILSLPNIMISQVRLPIYQGLHITAIITVTLILFKTAETMEISITNLISGQQSMQALVPSIMMELYIMAHQI